MPASRRAIKPGTIKDFSKVLVLLCCLAHRTQSLLLLQPLPVANELLMRQLEVVPYSPSSIIQDGTLLVSAMQTYSNSKSNSPPPMVQTQSQQMNDAMVISTMRGTEWRILEERYLSNPNASFGKGSPNVCKSVATFSGFASDANKGTVSVNYSCGSSSKTTSNGRWVTKPSRIAKGSIQLSARWKVKLPNEGGGSIIYKGFIDAEPIIGRSGKSVSATMTGLLVTGEEVGKEKVVGKFTADFVRQMDEEEVDAIKISGGEIYNADTNINKGPITFSPK